MQNKHFKLLNKIDFNSKIFKNICCWSEKLVLQYKTFNWQLYNIFILEKSLQKTFSFFSSCKLLVHYEGGKKNVGNKIYMK